jgi:hypothetical protein
MPEEGKSGIATPKLDTDLIKERLKAAEQIVKELPKCSSVRTLIEQIQLISREALNVIGADVVK